MSRTVAHHSPLTLPRTNTRPALALAVICGAQLMVVLDATIVNVALPTIHRDLGFTNADLVWITSSYSLMFGGLLLLGGRSGDLFGRRRMFMTGVSIFAIASLLGGLAENHVWLIVTRGLQGVGGAIASPTALALISTNFPEGQARARALGVYAAMSGGGAAVGLLLGGLLTALISWRWVFFVNVPVAVCVLTLAPRVLGESERAPGSLDIPGALTVTTGMISLVYGLTNAATHGWGDSRTLIALLLAVTLLAGFLAIESHSRAPMLALDIFADRNRSASYVVMLCIAAAMFAMFYFLTQFLQNILGYSALGAGVAFLPAALAIVGSAAVAARVVGRLGPRRLLLIGTLLTFFAFVLLTRLTITSSYPDVLAPLLLLGMGMGATFVPLTLTALSGVERERSGLASALLNTSQQIGGALGLAILSTIATTAISDRTHALSEIARGPLSETLAHQAAAHGYTRAFLVAAGLTLVAVFVSAVVIRVPGGKHSRSDAMAIAS